MREVASAEILAREMRASADAFGHVGARHLEMHAAGVDALGRSDLEEAFDLWMISETMRVFSPSTVQVLPCIGSMLQTMRRPSLRVARINRGRCSAILAAPKRPIRTRRPAELSGSSRSIRRSNASRIEARTAFQPDGIADAARKFDMSAIELPGAVADPEHMSSRRPILLARLIEPGQRLLVIEKQGLVAGEHRDRPGRLGEADLTMHLG